MSKIVSYKQINTQKLQAASNIIKLAGTLSSMTADFVDGYAQVMQYKREIRSLLKQVEVNLDNL